MTERQKEKRAMNAIMKALDLDPNNGYFQKPNWKLVDDISPSTYLEEAKLWCEFYEKPE